MLYSKSPFQPPGWGKAFSTFPRETEKKRAPLPAVGVGKPELQDPVAPRPIEHVRLTGILLIGYLVMLIEGVETVAVARLDAKGGGDGVGHAKVQDFLFPLPA
ncbi:hypothetical protein POKO110462_22860 [Pontibacter korlensis]